MKSIKTVFNIDHTLLVYLVQYFEQNISSLMNE